jgi:phosphomevalonate kinase
MEKNSTTVVSAPGKVLIAGGYLVLDHRFPGLVVSTSSRFYTVIKRGEATGEVNSRRIIVHSPQFEAAVWAYDVVVHGKTLEIQP